MDASIASLTIAGLDLVVTLTITIIIPPRNYAAKARSRSMIQVRYLRLVHTLVHLFMKYHSLIINIIIFVVNLHYLQKTASHFA